MASVVTGSRFKTIAVTKRCSIKALVEEKALKFKKGRGFYQLTKPEVIQDYKEVVIRRKTDGTIVTGDEVREVLGIPKSSKKFKLDLAEITDFDVFVQSTSVNRVLLAHTEFLYEVEDGDEATDAAGDGSKGRKKRGAVKRKAEEPEESKPSAKKPTKAAKKEEPAAKGGRGKRGAKRKTEDAAASSSTKEKETDEKPAAKGGRGKRGAKRKTEDTAASSSTKEKETDETDGGEGPSTAKKARVDAPPPPGGPVEIVFSFDTTGSMYPCLTQVRRSVSNTVKRLQKEIPGIRIAVIAHGDYWDTHTYVTKIMDFSTDGKKLCDFVENVQGTGGADWEECYELVLYEAREKLSWTPGTQRSLVMIGDAIPHPASFHMNTLNLDWKTEAKKLHDDLGVKIYAVQALNNSMSTSFYRSLASLTEGYHLHLDQFASIVDFIMAICFREQSLDQLQAFEVEVRGRGSGMNRSIHRLFDTLAGRETTYSGGTGTSGLTPVNPSRFQVLDVDERGDIRSFVQRNGLIFKPGGGFYEFTKPEKISDKKEVVLVDKVTGDMFTGPEACDLIGAGGTGKIKPASLDKWRVFVQSTSYNRVLMPNTGFLYEVDPEH